VDLANGDWMLSISFFVGVGMHFMILSIWSMVDVPGNRALPAAKKQQQHALWYNNNGMCMHDESLTKNLNLLPSHAMKYFITSQLGHASLSIPSCCHGAQ